MHQKNQVQVDVAVSTVQHVSAAWMLQGAT